MIFREIVVKTTAEQADMIADGFFSIGCSGVKILDRNDLLDVMKNGKFWDYVDEKLLANSDPAVKVSGFVAVEDAEAKKQELFDYLSEVYGLDLSNAEITHLDSDDADWYDTWKKFYKPIRLGKFTVVPKWLKYDASPEETVLLIDPGMAFGTGEHESTKLCLKLLSGVPLKDKSVIDVGTGSGILGIAAALCDAQRIYMCDIDSVSVKAAKENAELNRVADKVIIENADLLERGNEKADVVLGNLTADILIRLSESLPRFVKDGGKFICSGIIHKRKQDVIDAFVPRGFRLEQADIMGEWDALLFSYHGN